MHAQSGVVEEAASLPSKGEMQDRREQEDVGERGRLDERGQPLLEAVARGLPCQLLLLRGQLTLKQPVSIDLPDRVVDGATPR